MKKYRFTINVRTKLSPSEAIWYLTSKIKDALPVLSIDYDVVEDRPTNDEHHGGITNEGDT
jgi:hypothetical protein|tara:strand:- start:7 stop:189 length:183 start_codon:yes stop_codon:yes gene_type:complete